MDKSTIYNNIFELRVALTTDEYDKLTCFYLDGLGLEPSQGWHIFQQLQASFYTIQI